MKKTLLLTFILLLLVSCGKKTHDKSSALPEASTPPVVIDIPDNSTGVEIGETPQAETLVVNIPARKKYRPTVFDNGIFYASKTLRFYFPPTIPLTAGRSGDGLVFITMTAANGASLKCIYLGKEKSNRSAFNSASKPYEFDFCVDSSVLITKRNRTSIKNSSQNLINAAERSTLVHELERGDSVKIQVDSGNKHGPGRNVTTEVLVQLELF